MHQKGELKGGSKAESERGPLKKRGPLKRRGALGAGLFPGSFRRFSVARAGQASAEPPEPRRLLETPESAAPNLKKTRGFGRSLGEE